MQSFERRIERLEKQESGEKKSEVVLSELERAVATLAISGHPETRPPELAEYCARLEEWFQADDARLMSFRKAMTLVLAADAAEDDIHRKIADALGVYIP